MPRRRIRGYRPGQVIVVQLRRTDEIDGETPPDVIVYDAMFFTATGAGEHALRQIAHDLKLDMGTIKTLFTVESTHIKPIVM